MFFGTGILKFLQWFAAQWHIIYHYTCNVRSVMASVLILLIVPFIQQLWLFTPEALLHFVQFAALEYSSYHAAKSFSELLAAMQMVPESMSSILLIKVKLTKPFVKVRWPLKGKNRLELEY